MKKLTRYVIEFSDLEPLERTLKENGYNFKRWDIGAYRTVDNLTGIFSDSNERDIKINHSTCGEEGFLVHNAGTPVGGGGLILHLSKGEDSKLGRILSNLHKGLKN